MRIKESRRQPDAGNKTINRWENGRAKPSPLAIQRIEELLRRLGHDSADLLKSGFSNR